jgi:hypothetical protein
MIPGPRLNHHAIRVAMPFLRLVRREEYGYFAQLVLAQNVECLSFHGNPQYHFILRYSKTDTRLATLSDSKRSTTAKFSLTASSRCTRSFKP